jgi:hypothetical protein
MAFNDKQELRRVTQVLKECSGDQIVSLLRSACLGVNKQEDGTYVLDLREGDEDDDYDAEDDAWT